MIPFGSFFTLGDELSARAPRFFGEVLPVESGTVESIMALILGNVEVGSDERKAKKSSDVVAAAAEEKETSAWRSEVDAYLSRSNWCAPPV